MQVLTPYHVNAEEGGFLTCFSFFPFEDFKQTLSCQIHPDHLSSGIWFPRFDSSGQIYNQNDNQNQSNGDLQNGIVSLFFRCGLRKRFAPSATSFALCLSRCSLGRSSCSRRRFFCLGDTPSIHSTIPHRPQCQYQKQSVHNLYAVVAPWFPYTYSPSKDAVEPWKLL